MDNIILPNHESIILDIYNFFENKIYLCGGGADHYLLNKTETTLKDLDFITTSQQISKLETKKFIKFNSKLGYLSYFGHWNYQCTIEIFILDQIPDEELVLSNKLNIYITSVKNRLKIIDDILNTEYFKNRHNNFMELKQEYINLY